MIIAFQLLLVSTHTKDKRETIFPLTKKESSNPKKEKPTFNTTSANRTFRNSISKKVRWTYSTSVALSFYCIDHIFKSNFIFSQRIFWVNTIFTIVTINTTILVISFNSVVWHMHGSKMMNHLWIFIHMPKNYHIDICKAVTICFENTIFKQQQVVLALR